MNCRLSICEKCTCERRFERSLDALPANGNFAPVSRPKKLVRRDPREAAKLNRVRFKETLDILA